MLCIDGTNIIHNDPFIRTYPRRYATHICNMYIIIICSHESFSIPHLMTNDSIILNFHNTVPKLRPEINRHSLHYSTWNKENKHRLVQQEKCALWRSSAAWNICRMIVVWCSRSASHFLLALYTGYWLLLTRLEKRAEREAGYSDPSSSEVKNVWRYTSIPHTCWRSRTWFITDTT